MESKVTGFEFSKPFNRLKYVGGWHIESKNCIKSILHKGLQITCFVLLLAAITLQSIDFCLVFGNLEKTTYNLSTSIIVIAAIAKTFLFFIKSDVLNELRLNLWRDYDTFGDEGDIIIKRAAIKEIKLISRIFHAASAITYGFMLIFAYFSYKWGPRELPFPAFMPYNQDDTMIYHKYFLIQAVLGFFVIVIVIETDLTVYGFLLQLIVLYKTLNSKILKIDRIYDVKYTNNDMRETNLFLARKETEKKLKEILRHQAVFGKYVRTFEWIFNLNFIVQIIGGAVLVIMNTFQILKFQMDVSKSLKPLSQCICLVSIIVNIFYNCFYATLLRIEFEKIGNAAYSIAWHQMDKSLQKYVLNAILHSQRPPKVTAGKIILLDLNTFLSFLSVSYSWLTIFRKVAAN